MNELCLANRFQAEVFWLFQSHPIVLVIDTHASPNIVIQFPKMQNNNLFDIILIFNSMSLTYSWSLV